MTYSELRNALAWEPHIEGEIPPHKWRVVVGGMGGSALPSNAIRFLDPAVPICAHRDYDLPEDAGDNALFVAISYSGNTEETLSFARLAKERGYALVAIASGGALAAFARESGIPYVIVPEGMQPRNALFHQLRALNALLGRADLNEDLAAVQFDETVVEAQAKELAETLSGGFPLYYASRKNGFLAWVAKIHTNESGKMPSYANIFPELNHNEMQSFDSSAPEAVAMLARFVLMADASDDPRVAKRMEVFGELMRERKRTVAAISIEGASRSEKLARTWLLLHLTACALAKGRGADAETVPLVEEFKGRL